MAWNWIQLNWEYLVNRWGDQIMICCSLCLIPSTSSFFSFLCFLWHLYNIWNGILSEVKDHGIFPPGKQYTSLSIIPFLESSVSNWSIDSWNLQTCLNCIWVIREDPKGVLHKGLAHTAKNLPEMRKTQVWSLGREGPLEKGMAAQSSVLPGESHGQRSLVGYSPWARKESDTTKQLSIHLWFISNNAYFI